MILRFLACMLLVTATASAQDALGRGDALDNNLSIQGKRNAPRQLPRGVRNEELHDQGVLRGRAFGEGIGYSGASELRRILEAGETGEGLLEETLTNSPWYWDNWDRQSVTFVESGDLNYFNASFIDNWASSPQDMRSGRRIRTFAHAWTEEAARDTDDAGDGLPQHWSSRQRDQYRLTQVIGDRGMPSSVDPAGMAVGHFAAGQTQGALMASPLTGITFEMAGAPITRLGMSAWDAARMREDLDAGLMQDMFINPWRTDLAVVADRLEGRLDPANPFADPHRDILGSMADRLTAGETDEGLPAMEDAASWLVQHYAKLRGELAGVPIFDDEEDEGLDVVAAADAAEGESDIADIALILRHGQRIDALSSPDVGRFNELVRLAQRRLEEGEYFWAERRFDRALRLQPGHPLATAGLGHARIGAGLHLSAGHALHSLLSLQPEMIDVQYDEHLLPPRIELVTAAVEITNRLGEERDAATYGFLLAYIGHQLDDEEMISRGLDVFEGRVGSSDAFVSLLRTVWQEADEPVNSPPEAPPAP